MGGIASRVCHSRPYSEHLSHQLDRAQREREKEQPHRCIQERCEKDRNFCVHLMCNHKHTGGRADEQAWMTRIWEFEHQRTETTGTRWVRQVSLVRTPSGAQLNRQQRTASNAVQAYTKQMDSLRALQGVMKRRA